VGAFSTGVFVCGHDVVFSCTYLALFSQAFHVFAVFLQEETPFNWQFILATQGYSLFFCGLFEFKIRFLVVYGVFITPLDEMGVLVHKSKEPFTSGTVASAHYKGSALSCLVVRGLKIALYTGAAAINAVASG
jgi:hypothetical protein